MDMITNLLSKDNEYFNEKYTGSISTYAQSENIYADLLWDLKQIPQGQISKDPEYVNRMKRIIERLTDPVKKTLEELKGQNSNLSNTVKNGLYNCIIKNPEMTTDELNILATYMILFVYVLSRLGVDFT